MENEDNNKTLSSTTQEPGARNEGNNENPSKHEEDHTQQEEEDFREDFQCCVCLDLLFKPVVLACGHFSCFWCVCYAMNFWHESHCPICRHPFNHFPSVCQLLHFLLLKMYPIAYKRRERQVGEEEKKAGCFSPQFDDHFLLSHLCEGSDVPSNSLQVPTRPQAQLYSEKTKNCSLTGNEPGNGTQYQVSVADLLCAECKNLLVRPVVLNCGHVYCQSCIVDPVEGIPRCQICYSLHPNGFPNVCLVLEQFLEEHFPKLYSDRQESLPCQDASGAERQARKSSLAPKKGYSSQIAGSRPKVHPGIGCDSCGMSPIMGERYKCEGCVEKIGFDLCETCYKNPSKLLGRFNQQHKPEHEFVIVQPQSVRDLLNPGRSDEDGSNVSEDNVSEDEEIVNLALPITGYVTLSAEEARDTVAALNMSRVAALNQEDDSDGRSASGINRED